MEKGTKNNKKRVLTSFIVLILLLLIPVGIKFCKDKRPPQVVESVPGSSFTEITDSLSVSAPQDTLNPEPEIPVTIIVTEGMTLRHLAKKYYGNKIFWPYIYEENKDKIRNVHILTVGTVLAIPSREKYGIDPNDPASIARAREKAAEILSLQGQEMPRKHPVSEPETSPAEPPALPSDTVSRHEEIRPDIKTETDTTQHYFPETTQQKTDEIPVATGSKSGIPVMSLKTNLLEWCGLIINGEIEWYFARHFSLSAEYNYANWLFKDDYRQWRGGVISPEFRYWFSRDLFRRHYLGVYGQLGEYNVKPKKYGYQGDFYTVGLSYGYSFLLNRHLNLELGIGVGYMRTKYDKYIKSDNCYPYLNTTTKEYWGITKLKVSLVYNFWTK